MKEKIAVLIDGGHLRVYARKAHKTFVPDYIEKVALACGLADEKFTAFSSTIARPITAAQFSRSAERRGISSGPMLGYTNFPGKTYLPSASAC